MGLMGGDFNLMNAALSFVHLDDDSGLVVTVGVKKLGLLGGDDGSHEGSHQQSQVTLKLLNYHGQWGNIQQKQMLGPILEPSTTPEERGGEEKKKKKTHDGFGCFFKGFGWVFQVTHLYPKILEKALP